MKKQIVITLCTVLCAAAQTTNVVTTQQQDLLVLQKKRLVALDAQYEVQRAQYVAQRNIIERQIAQLQGATATTNALPITSQPSASTPTQ